MVLNRYYPFMVDDPAAIERQLVELVLHLGRSAYGDCFTGGLTPAQWMALRFFARANRFSRTVSAFAGFHGTTRGTASQTIRSLEEKGYLKRSKSRRDGRSSLFSLTGVSRRQLCRDPFETMVRAARRLTPVQRARTFDGLRGLMDALIRERGGQQLGLCALCGHLGPGPAGNDFQCCLMNEPLDAHETEQLCVRFRAGQGTDSH